MEGNAKKALPFIAQSHTKIVFSILCHTSCRLSRLYCYCKLKIIKKNINPIFEILLNIKLIYLNILQYALAATNCARDGR